jgi:ABC-2 type transport system permease protein
VSLRRSTAIAANEMRVLRRDPLPLIVLLAMPLLMAPLFDATFRATLVLAGHPHASGSDFGVPAQSVQFAFFLAPFTGFLFFREHAWRTWTRLRATGASPFEIAIGKAAPMIGLGVVQTLVLFGVGVALLDLHVSLHDAPALALVAFVYVCTSVMIGTALAATLSTIQQLNAVGFLGATLLGAIGGALVPISTLPQWMGRVAPATPQYWAMRAYRGVILDGRAGGSVALPVVVLAAFTVAAIAVSVHWLRRDVPKRGWT